MEKGNWLQVALACLAAGTLARAEEQVVVLGSPQATNDPAVAEAVVAMSVSTNLVQEQAEAAEAQEVAEIVRKSEEKARKEAAPPPGDPWDAFAPPIDTEYDWLQLTSGEWLKGDFKVMYDYELEFDSDELDLQKFDFDDVRQLRTRAMKTVFAEGEGGRRDTYVLRGLLTIKDDQVLLTRSEHQVELPRSRVISIAGGRERERDYWSGMASIGINMRGGNTETLDTTVQGRLERRTARTRLYAGYLANYSASKEEETSNNHRVNSHLDRFLTSRFYAQIYAAEYYRDPFANIRNQYSAGTGCGYDFIHNVRTDWTVGTGIGYQMIEYDSVEAGRDNDNSSPFLAAGTRLDHEVNNGLDLLYEYSLRWLNRDNGLYTHHMIGTLSFDLLSDLDLDISLIWDRIEEPQPRSDGTVPKKDDYQLVFGLTYDF